MDILSLLKRKRIRRFDSKGFSSIVGAMFLMLIVWSLASCYFVFTLQQNTIYNLAVREKTQFELDRVNEHVVASDAKYSISGNDVTVEMAISNTGNIPVELKSLWLLDNSTGNFGFKNTSILVPDGVTLVLSQTQGNAIRVTSNGPVNMSSISSWFVTARGNTLPVDRLAFLSYEAIYGPVAPVYSSFGYFYLNRTLDDKTPDFYQNVNQSGYLLGSPLDNGTGYPAYNIPGTCRPIFTIEVRNTDPNGRNVTINSYSAMNLRNKDRYICSVKNGMVTYYDDLNPVVIQPNEVVRLFFGAKKPAASYDDPKFERGDELGNKETIMVYIMICGYFSDGLPFSMDYPFASTYSWKDDNNGFTSLTPVTGATGSTVNLTVNWYNRGPQGSTQTIYWYDPAAGTLRTIASMTGKSGSFVVPAAPPGYYGIGVSDGICNMWATFQHT